MNLPGSLVGNRMDLGCSENPANRLLVLSLTVQITAYSISFWSPLILTSHWSSHSFSLSHRHSHRFCELQISHQILLTDCGKEMSGLISERLLQPFLIGIVWVYLVWSLISRSDPCCSFNLFGFRVILSHIIWCSAGNKSTVRTKGFFMYFWMCSIFMCVQLKLHTLATVLLKKK